jgi:PAS domain S-box-containing protein
MPTQNDAELIPVRSDEVVAFRNQRAVSTHPSARVIPRRDGTHSGALFTAFGLALVVLVGVIDYLTGVEISFSIFYLIPVSLVAWFAGKWPGLLIALTSAAACLTADSMGGSTFSHAAIPYWNAAVRLFFFVITVLLLSALTQLNDHLEKKVGERTNAMQTEIADRRRAEEALRQSEEQYRRFFFAEDLTGDFLATPDGKLLLCNPAFARMFGFASVEEVLADPTFTVFPDPLEKEYYLAILRSRERVNPHEHLFVRRDGERVVAVESLVGLFDAEDRLYQVQGYLLDITERKRAEEELRDSEERYRCQVEFSPDTIFIYAGGQIVFANTATARLLGAEAPEQLLGRSPFEFFHRNFHQAIQERIRLVLETGGPTPLMEQTWVRLDGRAVPVEATGHRLLWRGEPAVQVIARDLTERRHMEERVKQAERLAVIGQVVTGLAHESRNALQGGQACLERLTWKVQGHPEALDLLNRIQQELDRLHRLYDDLRGYAAPLKLARDFLNLADVWREAWARLASVREGRQVGFQEDTAELDLHCEVDRFRLEQVFRNILDNALAACRDPVRIAIHCAEAVLDGRPAVCIGVRDNGPGLTPEQQQKIFEPFFTTKTRGTGLGLAIARRIVEAHGGRIEVGAGAGPGAEILLTLPRRQA